MKDDERRNEFYKLQDEVFKGGQEYYNEILGE